MKRVRLRLARARDAEDMDDWLNEAASAFHGQSSMAPMERGALESLRATFPPEEQILVAAVQGQPVGVLAGRELDRDTWAIDFLAISKTERNLGYGAEAVLELERAHAGLHTLAGVPLGNGLAIYFWLRIGYRPIYPRSMTDGLASDRIWMARSPVRVAGRSVESSTHWFSAM